MNEEIIRAQDNARVFFKQSTTGHLVSRVYAETIKKSIIAFNSPSCHAELTREGSGLPLGGPKPVFLVLASNLEVKTDYQHRYWEWITSPEKSPWRLLFRNLKTPVEFLKTEGINKGFICPNEWFVDPEIRWPFIFNFLVAARASWENKQKILVWSRFVDHGVSECDAFFLSSYFIDHHINGLSKHSVNSNHWPINISPYKHDFDAFENGIPCSHSIRMDGQFSKNGQASDYYGTDKFFQKISAAEKTVVTRFTTYSSYNMSEVMSLFKTIKGDFRHEKS